MKKGKITNSGAIRPRYSNAGPFVDLGVGGDYSDVDTHETHTYNGGGLSGGKSGSGSSGSGVFDLNNFVDGLLGIGNSFVSTYWDKGSDVRADAYNRMYQESKKTTYILWAVIGLMLALGVVLLIRKTK